MTDNELALLFLMPHIPALSTLSVSLPAGRTVTQRLGDDELAGCHEELAGEVREVLRKGLVRLEGTGLRFVGPPIVERKRAIEAALAAQAVRFVRLQDLVIAKWDAIAAQMESFYQEYGDCVRHRRATAREDDAIRSRFSLTWSWLPLDLPEELGSMLFTTQERDAIRREIEDAAKASVARKVEDYLREMVGCLRTMADALRDQRVVNRKTIARLTEAYREVAAIVPHTTAAAEQIERIEQFGRLVADLDAARGEYDRMRKKPGALDGLAVAVEAARSEAMPMLDAWVLDLGEKSEVLTEPGDDEGIGAVVGSILGAHEAAGKVPELVTA